MQRIDLTKQRMKQSGVKLAYCPSTISEAVTKVLKAQMKMAKVFLKEKDVKHSNEDPEFLDSLSGIFDGSRILQ